MRDRVEGPKRGLKWDQAAADEAIDFFPAVLSITEGVKVGQPFSLLPWHVFVVGSIYGWKDRDGNRRFRFVWIETGKGQAKALALDTPIPTPSGWTTMGALRDGDTVVGDDGQPCRVVQAHPVVTGQDCYRVRFDDGTEIVANAGHLWRTEMRRSGNSGRAATTKGVPLAQRGAWRKGIRTTAEIAATLTYKNGRYASANHSVGMTEPLNLPDAALPVHPYVLGAWLGDGDSDGARMTVGDEDAATMTDILSACGVVLSPQGGHRFRFGLRSGRRWGARAENLGSRLRGLGLYGNKHIPPAYLRASRDQRLAVLQGLMDTDGTIGVDGQCCLGVTNRRIAEGALEIALSLGLKATVGTETARLNGVDCGEVYRVRFYAPEALPVFRLPRKLERQKVRHGRRRLSGERRIVACEPVESVPVRCITVDSPSSMFLAGREMVPTHNSPLMAGLGIYEIVGRKKQRAEVYAIGEDRKTANVMFRDAAAMCRAPIPRKGGLTLEGAGKVVIRGFGDNAWKIEHPGSGSKFEPVANSDAISGPKPTMVLGDEIHEMKTNKAISIWRAAIAKMSGDPMMVLGTNTPSVDQQVGTTYSEYFQKVLRGEFTDDGAFAYIARTDKTDDPFNDESCWIKALPALGITYPVENIRKEVQTAKGMISTSLTTKRLYFGIPVGTAGFWIDETAWLKIQGEVDEREMKGRRLHLALDLSQKNDLTALSGCWEGEHIHVKTWYWTCETRLAERSTANQIPYRELAEAGLIEITPTPIIDYEFVALQVQRLCREHDVFQLVFDPSFIGDFMKACADIGFDVWRYEGDDKPAGVGLRLVGHGQGGKVVFEGKQLCMPVSIRHFEDHILKGTVTVDRSRLTDICASNAVIQADAQKNKFFEKNKSRGHIDGLVTIAMAVGSATSEMEANTIDIMAMIA